MLAWRREDIHIYTEYLNAEYSAFNPSKCLEQWAADCAAPGDSRGLPAGAGIRTHNLGLPRVSSPTLYPLGHDCPCSLHLTHPKRIRTWSSGQPLYGARGAVRGSVPCSRALQSQFLPARDSNLRTTCKVEHKVSVATIHIQR